MKKKSLRALKRTHNIINFRENAAIHRMLQRKDFIGGQSARAFVFFSIFVLGFIPFTFSFKVYDFYKTIHSVFDVSVGVSRVSNNTVLNNIFRIFQDDLHNDR